MIIKFKYFANKANTIIVWNSPRLNTLDGAYRLTQDGSFRDLSPLQSCTQLILKPQPKGPYLIHYWEQIFSFTILYENDSNNLLYHIYHSNSCLNTCFILNPLIASMIEMCQLHLWIDKKWHMDTQLKLRLTYLFSIAYKLFADLN